MEVAEKPVTEKPKRVPKLTEDRFQLAEFARPLWVATVEKDTTIEQLLEPSFWAHIAKKVSPGTRIEVHTDAMTWMAELYVRSVGESGLAIAALNYYKFEGAEVATQSKDLYIDHRGPHAKWCVLRRSDGAVLASKMQTSTEASDALSELLLKSLGK